AECVGRHIRYRYRCGCQAGSLPEHVLQKRALGPDPVVLSQPSRSYHLPALPVMHLSLCPLPSRTKSSTSAQTMLQAQAMHLRRTSLSLPMEDALDRRDLEGVVINLINGSSVAQAEPA